MIRVLTASAIVITGLILWVLELRSDLAEEKLARHQAEMGLTELSNFIKEKEQRERALKPILDQLTTGDFEHADTPLDPELRALLECLRFPDSCHP